MSHPIGLYVHIPFCRQKCAYCDFPSFAGQEGLMAPYLNRLFLEIGEKGGGDWEISTLYIGGGTPSLLPPPMMAELLSRLRAHFSFAPQAECSCECNPGTVTEAFLSALRRGGINRLSFGAQASQSDLLRRLGRIHTWDRVEQSVALAQKAGFENVNLDLMLGLPGQTLGDVDETLDRALALSPTHLSCYGLILEEGTPLATRVQSGEWTLPQEDTERDMYELCRKRLAARGFVQYEISNFALPGFACRHNCDCWQRKEYLGLGSAACGFIGNKRYQNPAALADYLAGKPPEETVLSPQDARFESLMLGLRMMEGVSEEAFARMHGMTLEEAFGKKMRRPLEEGLLVRQNGHLKLTRRGMDVQNRVLVAFL